MRDRRPHDLAPRRLVVGDHLDAAGRGLVGHRGLEHGTVGLTDKRPLVVKAEQIVGPSLAVDRHLHQVAFVALMGRPHPVEDVDMGMGGIRELLDRGNEGVAGRRVALHDASGVGHVARPHPTAPAVLREADFLGVTKAVLRIQEHPERPRVRVREPVEEGRIVGHAVDRGLPRLVGQGMDALGVVRDPVALDAGHLLDGAEKRPGEVGVRCGPVELGGQDDLRPVEVFAQRLAGRLAKEGGQCSHRNLLSGDSMYRLIC